MISAWAGASQNLTSWQILSAYIIVRERLFFLIVTKFGIPILNNLFLSFFSLFIF